MLTFFAFLWIYGHFAQKTLLWGPFWHSKFFIGVNAEFFSPRHFIKRMTILSDDLKVGTLVETQKFCLHHAITYFYKGP